MDRLEQSDSPVATASHKWCAVASIYESIHPGVHQDKKLSERRAILVDAVDREEAERLGHELTPLYESEYENVYGHPVQWRLCQVEAVVELNDRKIGHGVEVWNDWIVKDTPRRKKPKRNIPSSAEND